MGELPAEALVLELPLEVAPDFEDEREAPLLLLREALLFEELREADLDDPEEALLFFVAVLGIKYLFF